MDCLAGLAGPTQLGGLRDPRLLVASFQEHACRRRCLGLPSCDFVCDALFGFDGGRHGEFTKNASTAELRHRDWLLLYRVLTGHRLRIRDCSDEGCVATLPDVSPGGGGAVQGLSISCPIYNPITAECLARTSLHVPRACSAVHPMVLDAFRSTSNGVLCDGCMESVHAAAFKVEAMLSASVSMSARGRKQSIRHAFSALQTDAERLLVMDYLQTSGGESGSVFVDDLRIRPSFRWALELTVRSVDAVARELGVVFEGGPGSKATVSFEGVSAEVVSVAAQRLQGSLFGETRRVVGSGTWLGIPEQAVNVCLPSLSLSATDVSIRNRAVRLPIVQSVGSMAAVALRVAVARAERCPWPLFARREFLRRGEAKVAYILPFTVGVQVAGARLVSIQAKWTLAAITGRSA